MPHLRSPFARNALALCTLALAAILSMPLDAFAHASGRGFVLLLPTGHYMVGGAVAVAASFAVLLAVPARHAWRLARWRLDLFALRFDERGATSLASFVVLAILVSAGFTGSPDPLSNPLPLAVWSLFWIGFTLAIGMFGNLFAWLNPWYGPYVLVQRLTRREQPAGSAAPGALASLGYLPAIILFTGFAWFEIVDLSPADPYRLAIVVSLYWLLNFIAILAFGYDSWTERGECFSAFYRLISRLSIFERTVDGRLRLCLPAGKLHGAAPLPPSGVVFLLLVLATVSFDGFSLTFFWLGVVGVNPLEFPGRSAVVGINSLGLLGMALLLCATFFLAVWSGERLAGGGNVRRAAGLLVWSIVPIALAYHVAHYLVALLVNGQYALAALSDPFSRGWNLFGTADNYISAGLVMGAQSAWVLWNLQAFAIVGGHVLAVFVAHGIAARLHGTRRHAMLSQVPLTGLMIAYTIFGLWLLSAPTAA